MQAQKKQVAIASTKDSDRINAFLSIFNTSFRELVVILDIQSPLLIYKEEENGLRTLYLVDKKQYSLIYKLVRTSSVKITHAGMYLGVLKSTDFIPSLHLGSVLARKKIAKNNLVWIDEHASKLYTYGRDVFGCSITKKSPGAFRENMWVLVMDNHDEFLGWGRLLASLESIEDQCKKPVIKNMLDIGMYLRCEESTCFPPEI